MIRKPEQAGLYPDDRWLNSESANDLGRFLRHYSFFIYGDRKAGLTAGPAAFFLADASWENEDTN